MIPSHGFTRTKPSIQPSPRRGGNGSGLETANRSDIASSTYCPCPKPENDRASFLGGFQVAFMLNADMGLVLDLDVTTRYKKENILFSTCRCWIDFFSASEVEWALATPTLATSRETPWPTSVVTRTPSRSGWLTSSQPGTKWLGTTIQILESQGSLGVSSRLGLVEYLGSKWLRVTKRRSVNENHSYKDKRLKLCEKKIRIAQNSKSLLDVQDQSFVTIKYLITIFSFRMGPMVEASNHKIRSGLAKPFLIEVCLWRCPSTDF